MRRQSLAPTPLGMMALGWAYSAALADLYLRAFYPPQAKHRKRSARGRPGQPAVAADDDVSRLTPKDEVLLLHLLE